jgi:hypothetical protein
VDHIGARLLHLVNKTEVYDAKVTSDNSDDVMVAKTVLIYDDYAAKGGMESYGLTSGTYPINHDSSYSQTKTKRGNVTGVQTFSIDEKIKWKSS